MNDRNVTPCDAHPDGPWRLTLGASRLVANGGQNDVVERPDKPSQLVKVQRADRMALNLHSSRLKVRLKRLVRHGAHRHVLHEYRVYLEATALGVELGHPPPLARLRA